MSQETQILKYLKEGYSITQLEALSRFDCLRLSGKIFNLKAKGHDIAMIRFKTPQGKNVAKYSLREHIEFV